MFAKRNQSDPGARLRGTGLVAHGVVGGLPAGDAGGPEGRAEKGERGGIVEGGTRRDMGRLGGPGEGPGVVRDGEAGADRRLRTRRQIEPGLSEGEAGETAGRPAYKDGNRGRTAEGAQMV